MKKYISRSSVSFSVVVDGRERRIRFTESSRGGSVFLCDDDRICKLIESRKDFGGIYRLDPFFPDNFKDKATAATAKKPVVAPPAKSKEILPSAPPEPHEPATGEIQDDTAVGDDGERGVENAGEAVEADSDTLPVEDETGADIEEAVGDDAMEAAQEVAEEMIVAMEVKTLSEAKQYLIGMGAQPSALRTKAGILMAAGIFNVSFPNLP
jgi:hypothetical protein